MNGREPQLDDDRGTEAHIGHRNATERATVPSNGETLRKGDHRVERSRIANGTSEPSREGCRRWNQLRSPSARRSAERTSVRRVADQDGVDAESGLVDDLLHDGLSEHGQKKLWANFQSADLSRRTWNHQPTHRQRGIGVRRDTSLCVGERSGVLADVDGGEEIDLNFETGERAQDERREVKSVRERRQLLYSLYKLMELTQCRYWHASRVHASQRRDRSRWTTPTRRRRQSSPRSRRTPAFRRVDCAWREPSGWESKA